MVINGEEKSYPEGIRLSQVLVQEGFQAQRIAVECNGEIIPRGDYEDTELSAVDHLEIVSFVGGG